MGMEFEGLRTSKQNILSKRVEERCIQQKVCVQFYSFMLDKFK